MKNKKNRKKERQKEKKNIKKRKTKSFNIYVIIVISKLGII